MRIVTNEINKFVEFLNSNWNYISNHIDSLPNKDKLEKRDMINDWLQFNWEVIFEASLDLTDKGLEVYGEGADINVNSERIRNLSIETSYYLGASLLDSNNNIDLLTGESLEMSTLNFFKVVNFNGQNFSESLITL